MKTAVSLPDAVFRGAERLARKLKKSRSKLYSDAIREYLARHDFDNVTEAMDGVISGLEPEPDPFVSAAARRILARTEW